MNDNLDDMAWDAASKHVLELETRIAELESQLAAPRYCCAECGSMGPFEGITYPAIPDRPEEYDMQCEECGSLRIDESPAAVIKTLLEKVDELEAHLAIMQQIADKLIRDTTWTKITAGPETWPPKTDEQILYWLGEAETGTAWKIRQSCEEDARDGEWKDQNDYWLPITPPQEES